MGAPQGTDKRRQTQKTTQKKYITKHKNPSCGKLDPAKKRT